MKCLNTQFKREETFIALTALWAFVESGLGGLMHAFHLPFTGIFLGGFSVLSIYMIAQYNSKPFKQVMKATFIVIAVKASVNPATSPMAYIAVFFQGLLGAFLFSLPFKSVVSPLLFAVLAMLESAFQKLLVLTLIFGESWYVAINKFFHSILKSIGLKDDIPFAVLIVAIYLSIYFIWGFILGIWIYRLPKQIKSRIHLYKDIKPVTVESIQKKRGSNKRFRFLIAISVIIFVSCFLVPTKDPWIEAITLVLRTGIVVILWIIIFMPVWRTILRKIQIKKFDETPFVLERLPYLRSISKPLYTEVSKSFKGLKKWKEFVLGLLVVSLREYDRETGANIM